MTIRILTSDCRDVLKTLPDASVHCVVTSPPYWGLRDYGVAGQFGLEPSYTDYVAAMVAVFREVRRVLRPDGTLWLNLGDSYATAGGYGGDQAPSNINGKQRTNEGSRSLGRQPQAIGLKHKDLCGIPWRVAFALQADGWYLRSDIIWAKPNPMPESVTDRPTKAHEYLFLMARSERYFYDAAAIAEKTNWPEGSWGASNPRPGIDVNGGNQGSGLFVGARETRNRRTVWEIPTAPFPEAHFATFPPALIEPCIKAGCPNGGTVLDPFGGAGTTGLVADRLGRNAILIELNPEYAEMARRRIHDDAGMFASVSSSEVRDAQGVERDQYDAFGRA